MLHLDRDIYPQTVPRTLGAANVSRNRVPLANSTERSIILALVPDDVVKVRTAAHAHMLVQSGFVQVKQTVFRIVRPVAIAVFPVPDRPPKATSVGMPTMLTGGIPAVG